MVYTNSGISPKDLQTIRDLINELIESGMYDIMVSYLTPQEQLVE